MKCERCGSSDTILIPLQLGDGSRIEFSTCHNCESKVWTSAGDRVTLQEVLALTSSHRPR
ncbi:MAG: hypothetical protein ACRDJ4_15285 [Actinomycetota bacterium]